MPNTKSAERRMRSSLRRQSANRRAKSRLKTLERAFVAKLNTGNKEAALTAFGQVSSALDKAAKSGSIHKGKADRKKSRLAARLNALAAASQPAPGS